MAERLNSGNRQVLGDVTSLANQRIEPQPVTGTKRKAADVPSDVDLEAIGCKVTVIDATCNQIRGKIRRILDSGEMNKGQFATVIGVSRKSLNDFLGQNGPMQGKQSATYTSAWEYFKERELDGIKMPSAKKQKADAPAAAKNSTVNMSGILLSGEASDSVRVYESCDEIRKKINAHLAKTGTSQAQFCRDLAAQYHTASKNIRSKQLTDFRSKKGPSSGNTSIVFYTAYVYFEKLRLAEGKPKTQHRLGMEKAHPGGFEITRPNNRIFFVKGEHPYEDQFGQIKII